MACGGNNATINTTNTTANAPADVTNAAPANGQNANTANASAAKSSSNGPKRIRFTKGSTNAIEYFEFEVGESKQFVVGAAKGQDLTIGNGGEIKITMITKRKMVDETNDSSS